MYIVNWILKNTKANYDIKRAKRVCKIIINIRNGCYVYIFKLPNYLIDRQITSIYNYREIPCRFRCKSLISWRVSGEKKN